MNYPERIEASMLRKFDIRRRLQDKRAAIHSLEIVITVDACQQKDEKGKPLLSNETLRSAAISRTLEEDEDYRKQLAEVRDLEEQLATEEAAFERLQMEWVLERDRLRREILEAEQRNAIAALKVADSIWYARQAAVPGYINGGTEPEIELPF